MTRQQILQAALVDINNMTTEELFRQTGRTSRMVQDAIVTARKKHAVLIVMKDEQQAHRIRNRVSHVPGISVRSYPYVNNNLIDWSNLSPLGEFANHELFIDHDVIYFNNRRLIDAMMKYDPKFEINGDDLRIAGTPTSDGSDNRYCLAA